MSELRSRYSDLVRIAIPLAILAAGGLGLLILKRQRAVEARPVEQEKPPPVDTVDVIRHEGELEIEVDGVVVPYREIELASEVDGRVEHKADVCRAGRFVDGNTLLLRIDRRDYELEERRLTKELEQADGAVKELEAEVENTQKLIEYGEQELEIREKDLKRVTAIHQDGVASDSQLDEATRARLQAANALELLRNQARLLQTKRGTLEARREHAAVALEKAQLALQRTEISFPEDTTGVIVADLVEEDDYVRKGTPVVTIEDTSKAEVRCSLRVDELYWLWTQMRNGREETAEDVPELAYQIPKAPAKVIYRLEDREYEWEGVLARYDGIGLDETTRTVPCRVVVDRPRQACVRSSTAGSRTVARPPALVRGMYVTVKIFAQPDADLLRIPEAAVRPGGRIWRFEPLATEATTESQGTLDVVDIEVVAVTTSEVLLVRVERDGRVVERAIDGVELQVRAGQVVELGESGDVKILDDSILKVVDGQKEQVIDGRILKVVDGRVMRVVDGRSVEVPAAQVVIPQGSKVIRATTKEAIVVADASRLGAGDRVVVKPPAAANQGMKVREQAD